MIQEAIHTLSTNHTHNRDTGNLPPVYDDLVDSTCSPRLSVFPALFSDYCSAYTIVAHMSPVHGLYHLSVLFCVSVFTDDGGRMATETFEYSIQCSLASVVQ